MQQVSGAAELGLHGVLPDLDVELQQCHGSGLISLQAVRRLQQQILPAEATNAYKIGLTLQPLQGTDYSAEARTRCRVMRDAQVRAMNQLDCHGAQYARQLQGC